MHRNATGQNVFKGVTEISGKIMTRTRRSDWSGFPEGWTGPYAQSSVQFSDPVKLDDQSFVVSTSFVQHRNFWAK